MYQNKGPLQLQYRGFDQVGLKPTEFNYVGQRPSLTQRPRAHTGASRPSPINAQLPRWSLTAPFALSQLNSERA